MSILRNDTRTPLSIPFNAQAAAQRWQALRDSPEDWAAFRTLCGKLTEDYLRKPLGALASALYHLGYKPFNANYLEDSDYLAQQASDIISAPKLAAIQRSYTIAHAASFDVTLGCSACCIRTAQGWRMMRSLDWNGAYYLGPAARRFSHTDGNTTTLSAGFVGMVGVLTFSRPGLTAALNYAPIKPTEQNGPLEFAHIDPLFLMRELVEHTEIDSVQTAIDFIKDKKVGSPAFIILCDQTNAVVVEISQHSEKNIVHAADGLLVQTNHYRDDTPDGDHPYAYQNAKRDDDSYELQKNSWRRRETLEMALRPLVDQPETEVRAACEKAFAKYPVQSGETAYWTWGAPADGSLDLWRRMPTPFQADLQVGAKKTAHKIIHLSDLHVGYLDCETRLEGIVTQILKDYSPTDNVIIVTGDLVDKADGGNYQKAKQQLDRLSAGGFTVLVVPGNHDYGSGGLVSRKHIDEFKQVFFGKQDISYPKLDIKVDDNIAFIGLDSMAETFDGADKLGADGELGCRQLARLDEILEQPELRGRKIVVYLHHHPFDESWVMQLKDHKAFERIVEGRVDYVLYGHDHDGYKEGGFVTWKEAGIQCHNASSSTGKSEAEHKPAAPVKVIELV